MQAQAGRAACIDHAAGVRELVQLGLEVRREAARQCLAGAHADLRQALVGHVHQVARRASLQRLPGLQADIGIPVTACGEVRELALQQGVGRQQTARQARQCARKVLPVVVVGDAKAAHLQIPLRSDALRVFEVQRIARAVRLAIVRQQTDADLAVEAGFQIAKLAVHSGPATGAHDRCDRGVAVRRDVPVVRHGSDKAAAAVERHDRRQPARFAGVAEREADARPAQDRHTEKAQHGALGNALVGVEVQMHAIRAQQPGRVARAVGRAARVRRHRRHRAVGVQDVDALRGSRRAGAADLEVRADDEALETREPKLRLGAGEHIALVRDAHVADGARDVVLGVVVELVGVHPHIGAPQFGIADGLHIQVGPAAQFVRAHEHRPVVGTLADRRWRQCVRQLQHDAGRVVERRVGPCRGCRDADRERDGARGQAGGTRRAHQAGSTERRQRTQQGPIRAGSPNRISGAAPAHAFDPVQPICRIDYP